jgi:broad-specificity NMP kinase
MTNTIQPKAIWVAGPSGSGKSVICDILGGQDMDQWGYHSDIFNPGKNWYVSVPILRERMYWLQDKPNQSPFFFGVMVNWKEIAALPWRAIAVLVVEPSILASRLRKRAINREGGRKTADEMKKVETAAYESNYWFQAGVELDAVLIDGDQPPKTIASIVRGLAKSS